MTDDVHGCTFQELTARLEAWAKGSWCTEAAIQLLIEHERWLRRTDFCATAVQVERSPMDCSCWIDWDAAARLLASAPAASSERRVLTLALALVAGREHPVDLGEALNGLDQTNAAYVLKAVAHAVGLHHCDISQVLGTPG